MTFCMDCFISVVSVTLVVYRKSRLYTSTCLRKSLISRNYFVLNPISYAVEGLYKWRAFWVPSLINSDVVSIVLSLNRLNFYVSYSLFP